jgi:hypothetical protein
MLVFPAQPRPSSAVEHTISPVGDLIWIRFIIFLSAAIFIFYLHTKEKMMGKEKRKV